MNADSPGVVVSGAGSGLGAAIAHRFGAANYRVAVTDRIEARAVRVAAELQAEGVDAFAQALDVTSGPDWDSVYQRALTEWGRVDVLVNNAGVAAAGRLEDSSLEDWQWILDTNLLGVVRGCHRFLPLMREQGSGHIINIASFAGMMPVPELSAYATAKAGVVALSEHLRIDLDGSGIGVSVVCPAFVQTRLLETMRGGDSRHREQAERWMAKSPVTAEDVADKVFNAVITNRFLVLTHRETRWAWRLRRWFPERCHRLVAAQARRLAHRADT
ncbi:MAG: SDR family oxidoreductase [Xanthomonadales bacterium]|nr:SDR family oxidoreductase [Xanthomonadales bacterium]